MSKDKTPRKLPTNREPRRFEGPDDQFKAFVEAARELECDDDPAAFDRMFERVVPPKRKPEEPAAEEAGGPPKRRKGQAR